METDNVLAVVQEHVDAFNANDKERFRATFSIDAVLVFRAVDRVSRGPQAITEAMWGLRDHFTNVKLQMTSAFADGNFASVELIRSCSHNKTGLRVTVPECATFALRNGKIATVHYYTDRMTELVQLGAVDLLDTSPIEMGTSAYQYRDVTARPAGVRHLWRLVSRRHKETAIAS